MNRIKLKEFKDFYCFFERLDDNQVNYVVLRNFEILPDSYECLIHGDIDVLTDDYKTFCNITNAKEIYHETYRVQNIITIGQEQITFDIRYVGDGYYDQEWASKILQNKQKIKDLFFVPENSDYFYSLLYHSLVHKRDISEDYYKRLPEIAEELNIKSFSINVLKDKKKARGFLNKFLAEEGYRYTEPKDVTVYLNRYFYKGKITSERRKYNISRYKKRILRQFKKIVN